DGGSGAAPQDTEAARHPPTERSRRPSRPRSSAGTHLSRTPALARVPFRPVKRPRPAPRPRLRAVSDRVRAGAEPVAAPGAHGTARAPCASSSGETSPTRTGNGTAWNGRVKNHDGIHRAPSRAAHRSAGILLGALSGEAEVHLETHRGNS